MRELTAVRRLTLHERDHPPVYTKADLAVMFPEDSPLALTASLKRLVRGKVLTRACGGIYVTTLAAWQTPYLLERIAQKMRQRHLSYVSLESALSQYSVISQVPMRLTLMTTGRSGEFHTPFGTIEFTHTKRSSLDIVRNTREVGYPLRLATKEAAYRDLRHVGRCLDLVDYEVLYEES